MTPEEIDAMEPGPKMDALIAEKVMGWVRLSGDSIPASITSPEVPEPHLKSVWVFNGVSMACEECGNMPPFSTDIAAAWQVVEKVNALAEYNSDHSMIVLNAPVGFVEASPMFELQLVKWGGVWNAVFDAPDETGESGWYELADFDGNNNCSRADTAPLAICRAALKAVTSAP